MKMRAHLIASGKKDAGFTLLELAIVIIITSVLLIGILQIVTPAYRMATQTQTKAKLDKIARAIDYYATQNFRVPCPSNPNSNVTNPPFGFENGSGASGAATPVVCPATIGVVPYRTLNLPADIVRDAWGNYITYAISAGFSQDTADDNIKVHALCRTTDWLNLDIVYDRDATSGYPIAPPVVTPKAARKARFCCSGAGLGSDLVIMDGNGNSQISISRPSADTKQLYENAGVLFPNPTTHNNEIAVPVATDTTTFVASTDRPTAPVYVLVSHGRNGEGAYDISTGLHRTTSANATQHEKDNAKDAANTYYDILPSDRVNGEQNFDDIVVWRTQDAMFAEQGQSCALP